MDHWTFTSNTNSSQSNAPNAYTHIFPKQQNPLLNNPVQGIRKAPIEMCELITRNAFIIIKFRVFDSNPCVNYTDFNLLIFQ